MTDSGQKPDTINARAKSMLMGDVDLGQYLFKNTNTMLPRKHQKNMSALLQLFGRGIIPIDVFCGGERAALCVLAPLSSLGNGKDTFSKWVPGDDYIIQTATEIPEGFKDAGSVQCEIVVREDIGAQDTWVLGPKRSHNINEYPRRHLARMGRLAGGTDAFKLIWRTMAVVFIWERNPTDDLESLLAWVNAL